MTLAMMTATGPAQVVAHPIEAFQAWFTQEDGQQTLWPGRIRLTDKFFESLMEHAVPLQPEAIGQLQNSALDLDAYSWFAHRLWRVNDPAGVVVSWVALKEQFGQEYADTKNFRRKFLGALKKATNVYKEARIEIVPRGLKLLPSPPPVMRSKVTVCLPAPAAAPGKPAASPAVNGGVLTKQDLVSEKALQQVPVIAPGWDKHFLAATYKSWVVEEKGEMPKYPDAAFLGWVKSFTKSKRPS